MKALALKKQGDDDISALRRWWSKKYNRPQNDPELQNMTLASLLVDFYGDLHERRKEIKTSIRENAGDRGKLEEALAVIEEVLEIRSSLDTWQEEVERALAEGRMPDWSKEVGS